MTIQIYILATPINFVAKLLQVEASPIRGSRATTESLGFELPRLSVGSDTDTVVHERVGVRFLFVLAKRLDANNDREADDDDTQDEKEELLLTHSRFSVFGLVYVLCCIYWMAQPRSIQAGLQVGIHLLRSTRRSVNYRPVPGKTKAGTPAN